jgi:hypothetical protein
MNHEFFENCMADLQHGAPDSLRHSGMTTKHPLSSIPEPDMELSSYDAGHSFSGGQELNFELPINGIGATLLSFPSYQYSNNPSHVSDTSLILGRPPSSASQTPNTMGTNAPIDKPLIPRRIIPRSMNGTSETIEAGRGTRASVQAAKRRGRKGKLPEKKKAKVSKMRRKKACATCFASHAEVSHHHCHCHPLCLTVIQVF